MKRLWSARPIDVLVFSAARLCSSKVGVSQTLLDSPRVYARSVLKSAYGQRHREVKSASTISIH